MKKRTRLELIVFVIVAVVYFFQLFSERNTAADAAPKQTESISVEQVINNKGKASITDALEPNRETAAQESLINDTAAAIKEESGQNAETAAQELTENGEYTAVADVAAYLHQFGHLPSNYIRKNDAKAAGWDPDEGNLDRVCPGKSIGGDRFGNYEKQLPEKKDRKYFECDVNYNKINGYRGQERIIYSNDGLIYYSGDHYNTFELLYGEP